MLRVPNLKLVPKKKFFWTETLLRFARIDRDLNVTADPEFLVAVDATDRCSGEEAKLNVLLQSGVIESGLDGVIVFPDVDRVIDQSGGWIEHNVLAGNRAQP